MRESRTYGFVRGVLGDQHPYRDSQTIRFGISFPRCPTQRLWSEGTADWGLFRLKIERTIGPDWVVRHQNRFFHIRRESRFARPSFIMII